MASSAEDNGSLPGESSRKGGTADDEEQQHHQSKRQQRRVEMQLQQKKKSSSGGKGDKRRPITPEDADRGAPGEVGEDSRPEEHSVPTRAHTSTEKMTATGATEQNTSSTGETDEEKEHVSAEEEKSNECWDHDRQPPITGPVNVIYCGVCGMPPDYCEFGSKWERCKAWLEQRHPQLLQYALPPEELAAMRDSNEKSTSRSSSSHGAGTEDSTACDSSSGATASDATAAGDLAQQLAENLRLSAAATQEAAAALGLYAADDLPAEAHPGGTKKKTPKNKAAAPPAVVTVQRQSRAKRKTMTVIVGLDMFGVKLPNATKLFSKRFACGASVSKNPQGHPPQQVEVQGDVEEAIVEVIESVFEVPSDKILVLPRK